MALHIYVERSTTSLFDSAFTPLADFPDSGATLSLDDYPVEPGQLYIYRARRYDDSTGLYSAWAHAYVRGAYPEKDTAMNDPNEIWTAADEVLYVSIETFSKVPTKATYRVPMVGGGFDNKVDSVNSSVKRNTVTARESTLKGMFNYSGDFRIEVRPEGGFLCFLAASDKYIASGTNANPVSYTHTFVNLKGLKSLTVIHRIGDTYHVYTGVYVSEFALSPDYNGTNTLVAQLKLGACGYFFLDTKYTPNAATILGVDTASLDVTTPYAPQDGVVTINGLRGAGSKDLSFTQTNKWEEVRERDGTRTAKTMIQGIGDTSLSATTYFSRRTMPHYYRSLGYDADPLANVGATIQRKTITAPVSLSFSPPASISGITNVLTFTFPNVDLNVSIKTGDGDASVELSFDGKPWDKVGNAFGSDFAVQVTNSYDSTQIVAPGVPISPIYLPADKVESRYEIGETQAGATTTGISAGAANPHFSATDGVYVGATLRFITGALAGQERTITAYTGASRSFTLGTALTGAPSTGDVFLLK